MAHASLKHTYRHEHHITQFNKILTSDFTVLPLVAARFECIVVTPCGLGRLAARKPAPQDGSSPNGLS